MQLIVEESLDVAQDFSPQVKLSGNGKDQRERFNIYPTRSTGIVYSTPKRKPLISKKNSKDSVNVKLSLTDKIKSCVVQVDIAKFSHKDNSLTPC